MFDKARRTLVIGLGETGLSVARYLSRQGVAVLIGKDAAVLGAVLGDAIPVTYAVDMLEAVTRAAGLALPGDCVLLSPACASTDMYRDFFERGEVFIMAVQEILKS